MYTNLTQSRKKISDKFKNFKFLTYANERN